MFLRYPVFPVETLTQFSAFYDFGAAAAAATPLLAITLTALALERVFLRDRTYRLLSTPLAQRALLIPLGRWRAPTFAVVSLFAIGSVVLPLLALLGASLAPDAYSHAWAKGADSLGRSLLLSALGATALAALGYACGYLIHHRALRLWRAVDTLALLLFTLPGTVIGVGLIALWNRPVTAFLYSSAAMLLLGYLAQYTALTSRVMQATLANLPRSLEESAQMAGAPWLARTLRVVLPAARPGAIAAWAIGFAFCLRDVGASMLVYPPGQDTFAVRIFTLMANGAPSLIAALCVMLVTVTLVCLAVLGWLLQAALARR
jgi:iron(III) transport system permease protein